MNRRGDIFRRPKRPVGRWIALFLVFSLIACGIYTVVDNGRVVIKTQRILVWDLPQALEGFTVLLISDLNGRSFGPGQKQIQNLLKDKKYNAVCIVGDMLGSAGNVGPFVELLSALDPTKPVFLVAGDADPSAVSRQAGGLVTTVSNWVSQAQKKGATYLDAPASMQVGKATVWFSDAEQITMDLDSAFEAYERAGLSRDDYYVNTAERVKQARSQMTENDLHIVLSHNPLTSDAIYRMREMNEAKGNTFLRTVDVLLSGGTAGGQWRLPFVGPLWSHDWLPAEEHTLGYHYAGALPQYITGGLDVSSGSPLPAIRLFNTPEMALLTFTSHIDDDVLPRD